MLRYHGESGEFIDAFVPSGSGGLDGPSGLAFGFDGSLYVSSFFTDNVLRYRGDNGTFIDEFVPTGSGGLDGPSDLLFGRDGRLYVNSVLTNSVLGYGVESGEFIDDFVPSGAGGLSEPRGLVFGWDNNLYVGSRLTNSVLRFHGPFGFRGRFDITPLVTWASSNVLVAVFQDPVNDPGVVTALAEGEAVITASLAAVSGEAFLRVFPGPVAAEAKPAEPSALSGPFPMEPIGILMLAIMDSSVDGNIVEGHGTGIHLVDSLNNMLVKNTLGGDTLSGLPHGNRVGVSTWLSGHNNVNFSDFLGNQEWAIQNLTPPTTSSETLTLPDLATLAPAIPAEVLPAPQDLAALMHLDPVDGSFNWFGDRLGPTSADVPGDGVSEGVIFSPWITRGFSKVVTDRIAYFGMNRPEPLNLGWNILSTPISLEGMTLGEVLNDCGAVFVQAFRFDPVTQGFVALNCSSLNPLLPGDSLFVRVFQPTTARLLFSPLVSGPPTRAMQDGWNLVGVTSQLLQVDRRGEESSPIIGDDLDLIYDWAFGFLPIALRDALISIDVSISQDQPGWTIVVSPSTNGTPFVFTRNTAGLGPNLHPFRGYWVFMENQDTLGGFSFTPETLPPWAPE